MKVVHPSFPLTIDERAIQIYRAGQIEAYDLGFSSIIAFIKEHLLMVQRHGEFTKYPVDGNTMQKLRGFAAANKHGQAINLTRKDSMELAEAILEALSCLDSFFETATGHKLTDEEKWGKQ